MGHPGHVTASRLIYRAAGAAVMAAAFIGVLGMLGLALGLLPVAALGNLLLAVIILAWLPAVAGVHAAESVRRGGCVMPAPRVALAPLLPQAFVSRVLAPSAPPPRARL